MDIRLQRIAIIAACLLVASCVEEKPTTYIPPDTDVSALLGPTVTLLNVQRYESSTHEADWLYFDVKGRRSVNILVIKGRFNTQDGVIIDQEYLGSMEPDQLEPDKTMIPQGKQWDQVEIQARGWQDEIIACEGCGTFKRLELPERKTP